jgi:hypothetical protein
MIAAKVFLVRCVIALSAFHTAVTEVRSSSFDLDLTLNNLIFTNNVILDTIVTSEPQCALACLEDTCCQGVTFTQGQNASPGSCRGYSTSYFGQGANQTNVGSRSYMKKKQKPCCKSCLLFFYHSMYLYLRFIINTISKNMLSTIISFSIIFFSMKMVFRAFFFL